MTQINLVYQCRVCGNIVEVLHSGAGELVCCGQPMELLKEKGTEEEGKEKHAPVAEKTDGKILVKVGSVPHPMEENHFIEWVEISSGGKTCRRFLRPGEKPEAEFAVPEGEFSVRIFCNVHGLWKN